MRHPFKAIILLALALVQMAACKSKAKLNLSAGIEVQEASLNGKLGVLIALRIRNDSQSPWHKNQIRFECRDMAGALLTETIDYGTLDDPAYDRPGKHAAHPNFEYTTINSPIFPTCMPTRVMVANTQGRAEFELVPKLLKWRRAY